MRPVSSYRVLATVGVLLVAGCSATGPTARTSAQDDVRIAETGLIPPPSSTASSQRDTPSRQNSGGAAMDHSSMQGMNHSMQGMPDSGHGSPDAGHGGMAHAGSGAGAPGQAAAATRTIKVVASDAMQFDPQEVRVKAGETVRFDITNAGRIPHEFVVGTPEEQTEHEKMMQQMPGMKHEEGNAVTLAPGERRTLVWTFGRSGVMEIACHVPGHYPAGMKSRVVVGAAGQ